MASKALNSRLMISSLILEIEDDLSFKTGTVTNIGTPSNKSSSIFSLYKKFQNVKCILFVLLFWTDNILK